MKKIIKLKSDRNSVGFGVSKTQYQHKLFPIEEDSKNINNKIKILYIYIYIYIYIYNPN
jgi:hypothetical protein